MRIETGERCPLPDDPLLASVASALDRAGDWAWVVDGRWRVVFMSHEIRWSFGGSRELVPVNLGEHLFGPIEVGSRLAQRYGPNTREAWREFLSGLGGLVLADTPGGRDELRAVVDPSLVDLVDELTPETDAVGSCSTLGGGVGGRFEVRHTALPIRDAAGTLRGTVLYGKPAAAMSVLASMAFQRDAQHLARTQQVAGAGRRPAAILFGDLESSSALARHLVDGELLRARSTPRTGRGRMRRRRGWAARTACRRRRRRILPCRDLRVRVRRRAGMRDGGAGPADGGDRGRGLCRPVGRRRDHAVRAPLGVDPLHGQHHDRCQDRGHRIGDEVNEAARIEACATGGRILASKALIERLDVADANTLGLDPDHTTYAQLAELATATDKARRDAPAIAVCEL